MTEPRRTDSQRAAGAALGGEVTQELGQSVRSTTVLMLTGLMRMPRVPQLEGCLRQGKPSIATMRRTRHHLLFRPIGLVVAAEVYATAAKAGAIDRYAAWLSTGSLRLDAAPFRDVIWSNGKVLSKGRVVATRLIERDLGLLGAADEAALLEAYQKLLGPSAKLPAFRSRRERA